jgi:hypothetical protein
MELNNYLKKYFTQLSYDNICNHNEFLTYENFKNFILNHYQLTHMESHNYIKYVKVKRQILKLNEHDKYINLLDEINEIVKAMYECHTFPNINIKKYMFKIYTLLKLVDERKESLINTIKIIRSLFNLKEEDAYFKNKIMIAVNTITHRYMTFLKYSKKLIFCINKLIELESIYNIDHTLIELNNIERSYLGKKSEYTANKIIIEYIRLINLENNSRIYFYESNIDIIKLFNIQTNHMENIKGEVDGIIIYKEDGNYFIEKIIEVKSSIKATFDDITKFVFLQKFINKLDLLDDFKVKYNDYVFTKISFKNIINKRLTDWVIYICLNNINQDYIEKSHLYFSTVLKIIDDDFIKDFYIDNSEKSILEKYNIIINNRDIIDNLFNVWTDNIQLGTPQCNIFISKK